MTELSKEYAAALFALALEGKAEDAIMQSLDRVKAAFDETPEYVELLASPGIASGERLAAIEGAFGGLLHEHVVSFIGLLCEKGRIRLFADCVEAYRQLLHMKQSVSTAHVRSAVRLTEAERGALTRKLEQISGNTVTLICSEDPSLIGGVIVEMNGTVMDGSLRHRLREVKEVMKE